MMTLKDLRKAHKLSQTALAERLGTSKQNIYKLERGETKLSLEWITRLEAIFGRDTLQLLPDRARSAVAAFSRETSRDALSATDIDLASIPVVGAVQAGAWLEAMEAPQDDFEQIYAPVEPAYSRFRRFALRVVGPSMDRVYLDGTYLICIKFVDLGTAPRHGDRVIVQRCTPSGLMEATVKEVVVTASGTIELWPRSTHPAHQKPIIIDHGADPEDEDYAVHIHALVIGSYRRETRI